MGASMQLSVEPRHQLRDWDQAEREESSCLSIITTSTITSNKELYYNLLQRKVDIRAPTQLQPAYVVDIVGRRLSSRSLLWIKTDHQWHPKNIRECFAEILNALAFMLRQIYIRCQIVLFHEHRSPEGTDEPIRLQVARTQRSR
ncbi:PREDICTED: uncharacterized protein LOC105448362 [Wasmannia auropunctata]|uniref:uncharacterized protein LOC105448362 n=1 Tax=Wasmannia auropunctata TaxID=64793 RepID=UPI0005F07CFA|nr:PREDICTED: uncharacterized protein LOC105448362 [Wasmannia auropunctata]